MKVYFTCSTAEFFKYKNIYYKIRNFLITEKHTLTRDWLPKTEKRLEDGKKDVWDIKEIYSECMKAINQSELVIIEDTVSNFSTGHQITIALQRQKPTLVLWQGGKHRHFNQMFIHGVESDLLEVKEYTSKNLEHIITEFINKYSNSKEKNRFHLVLNQVERAYLDWLQQNYGKSRTKVIRDLIRENLNKDKEYSKYLRK